MQDNDKQAVDIQRLYDRQSELERRLSEYERRIHAGTVAGRVILWLVGGLGAVVALGIQVADFFGWGPR